MNISANHPSNNDQDIIRKCRDGYTEAFGHLVRKYQRQVYNVCYRFCGNQDEALDLCQEIFITVYEKLSSFRAEAKFYTWLYRIAVNKSLSHCRKLGQNQQEELDPDKMVSVESVSGNAVDRESQALVRKVIDELPDNFRAVIVLFYYENLSYQEISETLDCSLGTVMSRLYYGRLKVKTKLERKGFRMYVIMLVL